MADGIDIEQTARGSLEAFADIMSGKDDDELGVEDVCDAFFVRCESAFLERQGSWLTLAVGGPNVFVDMHKLVVAAYWGSRSGVWFVQDLLDDSYAAVEALYELRDWFAELDEAA